MTTTAHEDQYLAAPEPVREPMSREAILRRNIASLEVALRTQTERAEAAEAELANLTQQKPVMKYMGRRLTPKDTMESWGIDCDVSVKPEMGTPLYAVPVPAPHKGATHCDDCGLTWLDDGLNPLGCPYCKDTVPAPAVQLVDGSDDYYDYLGALVEQHPAGVMRRNTDDKAPAVPDDSVILDWLEMQRVEVDSVVGHRPKHGFLSVGDGGGKSDLRSKVIALLQSAEVKS
jgi:hypothetical protein